jgi:hypothetical protein
MTIFRCKTESRKIRVTEIVKLKTNYWIPAFAGMTNYLGCEEGLRPSSLNKLPPFEGEGDTGLLAVRQRRTMAGEG